MPCHLYFLCTFFFQHVAILDIDEKTGVDFQNELNATYGAGKAKFYRVDVTNDEQLFEAFQATFEGQGGLDLVINNAGIMNDAPHIYKKEIEINVVSKTNKLSSSSVSKEKTQFL